jgi:transposase
MLCDRCSYRGNLVTRTHASEPAGRGLPSPAPRRLATDGCDGQGLRIPVLSGIEVDQQVTGAPWRDVPPAYGPWQMVYELFRRWQLYGTCRAILQARSDAAGLITWDLSVDSTITRAHQHAAGARKQGDLQAEPRPAAEPASLPMKGWAGPQRLTIRIHLACEQRQKLFLALTDESGNLIWSSSAHRGAASEIRAADQDRIASRLRTAGLGALADTGFTGLDPDPDDPVIIGRTSTRTQQDHTRPAAV